MADTNITECQKRCIRADGFVRMRKLIIFYLSAKKSLVIFNAYNADLHLRYCALNISKKSFGYISASSSIKINISPLDASIPAFLPPLTLRFFCSFP